MTLTCLQCGPIPTPSLTHCPHCNSHLQNAPIHQEALADLTRRQNSDFAAPFEYKRSLLTVPGKPTATAMISNHTDTLAKAIRDNFVPRDTDVWIATYPKSGTTWVQEMLSLLLYGEGNAAQGQEVGVGLSTDEHVMWLEAICAINASSLTDKDEVEVVKAIQPLLTRVNDQEGPRCFKSHSPLGLLQYMLTSKSKIIHVARNPKDVAVSMWHHTCSKNFGYDGPFEHFLEKLFVTGEVESGAWWDFVLPYVNCENSTAIDKSAGVVLTSDQVLTVWYEDLMDDPLRELNRMANYLDISFSDAGLSASDIIERCSFSAMKNREKTGGLRLPGKLAVADSSEENGSNESVCKNHIRKGGKGGWRKYFTSEQEIAFDAAHEKWLLKYGARVDLQFE